MILKDPKCVFVHIPKVAGQSIESVFISHAGLTWETRSPLLLRSNEDPSLGPPRLAHLTAREYVECGHMTLDEWNSSFTFAFVRNPWARAVSMYKWHGLHRIMSFPSFVNHKIEQIYFKEKYYFFRPQWDFVSNDSGDTIVDFVGRLESIEADFETVCSHLGWEPKSLPHKNRSDGNPLSLNYWQGYLRLPFFLRDAFRHFRYKKSTYKSYYDKKSADKIGDLYEMDVNNFGYSFDDLAGA